LTANGKAQVLSTGQALVGPHKLIDPSKLAHVFVSPRQRAQVTFELLFTGGEALRQAGKVSTTEQLAEWNYGEYEGLLTKEICARRVERGLDTVRAWDIWRDGCEGGEYAILPGFPWRWGERWGFLANIRIGRQSRCPSG
jgi:probable phosphoglycerate mutase